MCPALFPPLKSGHPCGLLGETVNEFSFAFIAPLGPRITAGMLFMLLALRPPLNPVMPFCLNGIRRLKIGGMRTNDRL